jgi:vacuolar-type H+-ATPase subunit I/STV1
MKIIITESQYRFLVENTVEIDNILDKMNKIGYEKLKNNEKMTLKQYSEWLNSGKKGDFNPQNDEKNDDFDTLEGSEYTTVLQDNSEFTFSFEYKDVLDTENLYYGVVTWNSEDWFGVIATDKAGKITEIDFVLDSGEFQTYTIDDKSGGYDKSKEVRLQDELGKQLPEVKYFFYSEVVPDLE